MLDNLGLGEFFSLALLALLFFGPKQLPQIGAQLGRWIRGLTQYSSAFLNEWRDEALVMHDAVQEVKGIRDEIVAAKAEIVGTLDTARTEMGDAVSGATRDVQQQIKHSTHVLPETDTPPEAPAPEGAGTDAVDGLHRPQHSEPLADDESERPSGETRDSVSYCAPPHPTPSTCPSAQIEGLRGQVDLLRTEMRVLRAD